MNMLTTMQDPRWRKLAMVFCQATGLKAGDKVLLHAIDLEALPLLMTFYKEALLRGAASVDYIVTLPELERFFLEAATDEQINFFPGWDLERMKQMDVFMAARARANALYLKGVPGERISARGKVMDPVLRQRVDKTRWCITYTPTDGDAMMAGMTTPDYMDFFFDACIQDYGAMKKNHEALKALMERTDRVHIVGQDTDLRFSIKGIPAVSCHGEKNIPDGEVYTAPVRDSVNGIITYNTPSIYNGREWTGVQLTFEGGKIVEANCGQGAAEINKVFDTDPGARYVGEFAVGTNPGIRQAAKNILFDEKIFASIHFTPGASYEDAPNGNNSAVHWDLVHMFTPEVDGGYVEFDGVKIMEDGAFVHPDLLPLNPATI